MSENKIFVEKRIKVLKSYKKKEVREMARMTSKGLKTKAYIRKYSKDFNGSLTDKDVMKLIEVSRVTYYKYKKIVAQEVYDRD